LLERTALGAAMPEPEIYRFSPISRLLRSAPSRIQLARSSDELREALQAAFDASGAEVLSLDVFDTLLLRDNQSEARRFWELSKLIRKDLVGAKSYPRAAKLSDEDFLLARVEGMRVSYRTRKPVKACFEGVLDDVVKIARRALGLPATVDKRFIAAEIAYEASVLAINEAVMDLARAVKAKGGRVILVSDMYLRSEHISAILEKVDADAVKVVDQIFSSGDLVVSKRSGRIFREIERRFELGPGAFFHIGDALVGDVSKPREAGWSALHFPVSDAEAQAREADVAAFIDEMHALGLDVSDWAKV
jgi:FMN phosphatase YigB (HAD superfamily)